MSVLVRSRPEDSLKLQTIARKAYALNFADHWNGNGLELYLDKEFGSKRLTKDLNDLDTYYAFIKSEGESIGFVKMKYLHNPELSEESNCELEKIYILPEAKGKGIGKLVMNQLISEARDLGKQFLFLCVIDTNESAIAFYLNNGFELHSKTELNDTNFKNELRGMHRLRLKL
ncbi:MAG: GNAT family N-acetyltransferase [bacterium]|nr:GNAT family N-acetyltransferase [bacterium]